MSPPRPLRLTFPGPVLACGLYLPDKLYSEPRVRQIGLQQWVVGSRLWRLPDGYLLQFPTPQTLDPRQTSGLPVIELEGLLSALPLTPKELRRITAAPGDLLLVRAGRLEVEPLTAATLVAPSGWLDCTGVRFARGDSLGALPAPPKAARGRTKDDLRAILSHRVPPSAPAQQALLERLQNKADPASAAQWGRPSRAPQPSLWDRLGDGLIRHSGLWRLIANEQERYFRRMIDMFQSGDLDQGIRHAIPLNRASDPMASLPSWAIPRPRKTLKLSRGTAAAGYAASDDGYQLLQNLYRSSARQLEQQGRIEEAAWVLAELLGENEQAVALLERHGQLRAAAQLAEARELRPDLVVRLWLLAGDAERARTIARLTGSFATAIELLQRPHPELAKALRIDWAQYAAQKGDYELAVEAIWRLPELRPQADEWMAIAIEAGGTSGIRLLARRLAESEERFEEDAARVADLVTATEADSALLRSELLRALVKGSATRATRQMAHQLLRRVAQESRQEASDWGDQELNRVVRFINDAALAQEWPVSTPRPPTPPPQLAAMTHPVTCHASGRGTLPISDLALTDSGRYLIALGEAGVRLVNRSGKGLTQFALPADHLIANDQGNRFITLAERGPLQRLGRIDSDRRSAKVWTEGVLDHYADSYNGATWFTSSGNGLYAVDTHAHDLHALWSVGDLPGPITHMARSTSDLALLIETAGAAPQLWHYGLADLRLRSRLPLAGRPSLGGFDTLLADGRRLALHYDEEGQLLLAEERPTDGTLQESTLIRLGVGGEVLRAAANAAWLLLECEATETTELQLYDRLHKRLRARLAFEGHHRLCWRLQGHALLVASAAGQLLHFDLSRGERITAINL